MNYWRLTRFIKDICRNIRNTYQRAVRGYSNDDLWNLDWHIATIISAGLKKIMNDGYSVSMRYYDQETNKVDTDKRNQEYLAAITAIEAWMEDDFNVEKYNKAKEAMHWYADTFGEHWD